MQRVAENAIDHLVAPTSSHIGPQGLTPAIRKIARVVELPNRGQFLALSSRIPHPHRGVSIGVAEREIFRHPFDEPQREPLERGPGRVIGLAACDVVLKGVNELVAKHMVGICQRSRHRQRDAPFDTLCHTACTLTDALNHVGLLEVGTRGVQHNRLRLCELVGEHLAESRAPSLGEPCDVRRRFAFFGIKINIEVIGLEHFELKRFVLDFIATEISGLRECGHRRRGGQYNED